MKRLFLVFASLMACSAMFAQKKSPAVLEIGNQSFTLDEFEFVYDKNNQLSQSPLSPREYLDLFVNYKLKVAEAIRQGYDQKESFVKEFAFYRDELAKPYLTDKRAEDEVITEAYDHLKYEVDASHILIRFPQQAPSPADTLKAWQRIHELKEMITNGQPFETVAAQYSEDPSAKQNNGRLGYFSGFQMVYPFEAVAYQTPVGTMSDVVRTSFGYHLIKVHDKRLSGGEILVSHIMKMFPYNTPGPQEAKAKTTIDSIYGLIKQGADFEKLSRELSDDQQSAVNDGQMPWFSASRMVPEFAAPAFALKQNGEISAPIKTPFGWHIIKRIDHRGIAPLDSMKDEIAKRVASDERAFAGQKAVIARLKARDQFVSYPSNLTPIKTLLTTANLTDSLFYASALKMKEPMCAFSGKTLLQSDFIQMLQNQNWQVIGKSESDLDAQFEQFCNARLLDNEKENLAKTKPEYRFLVSEYHDGLLIFEISQAEIWNKAAADSSGLTAFFDQRKSSYIKPVSWEGNIYYCADDAIYQTVKQTLGDQKQAFTDSLFASLSIPPQAVKVEKGKYIKGAHPLTDSLVWASNNTSVKFPKGYTQAWLVGQQHPETLYQLNEIRGQVLSDYQVEIEKQWIASLKNSFQPKVNYKVLKKMKPATAK